jgi:hypothetical protein
VVKTRYKPVIVHWGDAFIDTDDFTEKDARKTEPVWRKTIGFLVAKNQYGVVLATDEYDRKKDGVNAKMFIPHGMIKEIHEWQQQSLDT